MIFPYRLLAILAGLGIFFASLFAYHHFDKQAAVRVAVENAKTELWIEYQKRFEKAVTDARNREHELIQESYRIEREKNEQIKALDKRLASALDSLRQRPPRASSSGKPSGGSPCDCQGTTGASLSREDAGFLVREAARADRLREALDACYKQYDEVRDSLSQ